MEEHFWNKSGNSLVKIVNPDADESFYWKDKERDAIGGQVHCIVKGCESLPQTVCKQCIEYICENHVYRHPNCDEGR